MKEDSPRPLRVCLVIDDLQAAGTEKQVLALLRRLPEYNVKPMLVLLKGHSTNPHLRASVSCPLVELGLRSLLSIQGAGCLIRLSRVLVEYRIDVVQLYFRDSTIAATLAAQLAGIPAVVRMRTNLGYDIRTIDKVVNGLLCTWHAATVANCQAARDSLLAQERRLSQQRTLVIPNGVDRPTANTPAGLLLPGVKVVGCVANLRPVKGLTTLIQAAKLVAVYHPDVQFRIAGEGLQRLELERLIAQLGLQQHCELIGAVDSWAFARELTVAISASSSEGMSNAVLEYMAAGLPVVATAVGGTRELIEHERTGLLIAPDDPAAMASAIRLLLERPFLARSLGQTALQVARDCFSRERMVEGYASLYRQLATA